MTYQPGQRVRIKGMIEHPFTWDWTTKGVVIEPKPENLPLPDGYHVVRYDDGGCLLVHETRLRKCEEQSQ